MAISKTKAMIALGVLDLARQASHALSARQEAERERARPGAGVRDDARRLAREARERMPDHLTWGLPPWRHERRLLERLRAWLPIAGIAALSTAAVVLAARKASRDHATAPGGDGDAVATDPRVVGAARAGSKAVEAGVEKVAEGASAAQAGTAAAASAGTSAVGHAAGAKVKDELDERVVQPAREQLQERVVKPAKRRVITYGSLALVGITLYVVIVAALVQLAVAALS